MFNLYLALGPLRDVTHVFGLTSRPRITGELGTLDNHLRDGHWYFYFSDWGCCRQVRPPVPAPRLVAPRCAPRPRPASRGPPMAARASSGAQCPLLDTSTMNSGGAV